MLTPRYTCAAHIKCVIAERKALEMSQCNVSKIQHGGFLKKKGELV